MAAMTIAEAISQACAWVQEVRTDITNAFAGFIPNRPSDGSSQYPFVAVLADQASIGYGQHFSTTVPLRIYIGREASANTTEQYQATVGLLYADLDALCTSIADNQCRVAGRHVDQVSVLLPEDQPRPLFIARLNLNMTFPALVSGDTFLA